MHETFLQAIREAPEDDTPRLVYADWLDEHDQPERAEFIRAQIQVTRLSPHSRCRTPLLRRARELLAAHGEVWLQSLPKWARRRCEFQRGFVTHVTCTALQFIKHGEALMRAAPVRSLRIRRGEGHIIALAESPHLAGLTALDLRSNSAGDAGAEALAASPHIRHLTTLRLTYNNIGVAGMRAMAVSPYLPRPKVLSLRANFLQDEGAELLAASPLLEQVVTLDLAASHIAQRGIQALAASPYLRHVRKLSLYGNRFGDAGAHALLASSHLGQLRQLNVRHCNIESARNALQQRFGSQVHL